MTERLGKKLTTTSWVHFLDFTTLLRSEREENTFNCIEAYTVLEWVHDMKLHAHATRQKTMSWYRLLKTRCNDVVGATLFLVVNNIKQYSWARIGPQSGVTMPNKIVYDIEQRCPNNIVASCFQQLLFICRVPNTRLTHTTNFLTKDLPSKRPIPLISFQVMSGMESNVLVLSWTPVKSMMSCVT